MMFSGEQQAIPGKPICLNRLMLMMSVFKPSPRYLTRLRVVISLWAVSILALGILCAWLLGINGEHTRQATIMVQAVVILDILWYLPALMMVQSSYKNRTYQLDENEITIQSGWWTLSVHHIPLSNVVAFETRWDMLDRWLEIGTLEVYVISRHHVNGLCLRMAGLADVERVAQLANRLLKRMRDERVAEVIFTGGLPKQSMLSNRR